MTPSPVMARNFGAANRDVGLLGVLRLVLFLLSASATIVGASEAVQMKKNDVCQNRLHRNPKQQMQASRSMFQMNFLICAEIGCVKIWVCPSALTSDTADTNMQLYFERKNGTQKYQDCIFCQVHVPCGRHCVSYCEFRVFMPKNDKNGPVSSILGAHKMCHLPHNRFFM